MPDLGFQIIEVAPAANALVPLLHFKLRILNSPETESIRAITLQTQIQFQPGKRVYTDAEKERLIELFGAPERWGETLRNKLWTHVPCNVCAFSGNVETILPVPCTWDLNVLATKYFQGLEGGEISLLFLFNGSVFYSGTDGRLQIQQIPWDKECSFRMPLATWRDAMNRLFANSAWVNLRRDHFDALCDYKRRHGLTSWDETIARLLCERRTE